MARFGLLLVLAWLASCRHWPPRPTPDPRQCRPAGFMCDLSEECCSGSCHEPSTGGPGNCR